MQHEFLLPRIPVVIRFALPSDLDSLGWSDGPDAYSRHENYLERQNRGELLYLIADANNYPIGHAVLIWKGRPSAPDYPDIQDVRVFEPFRGLGIGTALVEACEVECRTRRIERVGLAVSVENVRARTLYERLGYRIVGTAPYEDIAYVWKDHSGREHRTTTHVMNMVKKLL